MRRIYLLIYTILLSSGFLFAQQPPLCEDDVDATQDTEVVDNTLQASNKLTVNRKIGVGDTLRLIGGQAIELLPGFEAEEGSFVEGANGECVPLGEEEECEDCQEIGLAITANEQCSYEWQNEDIPEEDRNDPLIEVCPTETDIYTLKIIYLDGHIEEMEFEVEVEEKSLEFKEDPYYLCDGNNSVILEVEGDYETYQWARKVNGDVIGTGSTYEAIETGTYHLTVTDNCDNTIEGNVFVQPASNPSVSITPDDATICVTDPEANIKPNLEKNVACSVNTVTLTASGGTSYTWSTGDSGAELDVAASGEYSVTATNEVGCTAITGVVVEDCDPPTVDQSGSTLCPDGIVILTVTSDYDEGTDPIWVNPNGNNVVGKSNTVTEPGIYKVTTTNNGCEASTEVEIMLEEVDMIEIMTSPDPPSLCNGGTVILTATGNFAKWEWQKQDETGIFESIEGETERRFYATETGSYKVFGFTVPRQCKAESQSITIISSDIEIPKPIIFTDPSPLLSCVKEILNDDGSTTLENEVILMRIENIVEYADPEISWISPSGVISSIQPEYLARETDPGEWKVEIKDGDTGCYTHEFIQVEPPVIIREPRITPTEAIICEGETVNVELVHSYDNSHTIEWKNSAGDIVDNSMIDEVGNYTVTVSKSICSFSNSFEVDGGSQDIVLVGKFHEDLDVVNDDTGNLYSGFDFTLGEDESNAIAYYSGQNMNISLNVKLCESNTSPDNLFVRGSGKPDGISGCNNEGIYYFGCNEAKGNWTEIEDIVEAIWNPFTTRELRRNQFNRPASEILTYYKAPSDDECVASPTIYLASPYDGECGAFSTLLGCIFNMQGISKKRVNPEPIGQGENFLVKKWAFTENPSNPGNYYPYINEMGEEYSVSIRGEENIYNWIGSPEVTDLDGVPGQGFSNPYSDFDNHFLVEVLGKLYDPSYGKGPYNTIKSVFKNLICQSC